MNNKNLATILINLVGGKENIILVFNCYTRARVNVKDVNKVNVDKIKTTEGVIGVVIDKNQIQIVVGPGKAVKLTQEMLSQLKDELNTNKQEEVKEKKEYIKTKEEVRKKTNKGFTSLIRKISGIFVPIIPMFVACGLLLGIYTICEQHAPGFKGSDFAKVFNVIATSVFTVLNIVVGYNATKEFGGDAIIGASLAGALTIKNELNLSGIKIGFYIFEYGEVGIFTILLTAIGAAYVERFIRKHMPNIIDAFMTPLLTVIIIYAAALFILQPIGACLNKGLELLFRGISDNVPLLLGIIPMFYLLLVLTGTHHSLMVVSTALTKNGTVLAYVMPVQLMAGAAEVGAAIYVMIKTKNAKLRKNIIGSLPIGILGIDEPLIWGMSVPLKRPFIAAGLGGFIGGTFLAGLQVGSKLSEATGIQAALVTNKPITYAVGFIISIIMGFIFQFLIGFKDPIETTDETSGENKEQYIETSYAVKLYKKYREKHPKKQKVKA